TREGSLEGTQTPPFAEGGLFPQVDRQVATGPERNAERCTRAPGGDAPRGGLTFLRAAKAAAAHTWAGSASACRARLDYASQNSRREQDAAAAGCSGSYPTAQGPRTALPRIPRPPLTLPRRKCRPRRRQCVGFRARLVRSNSGAPLSGSQTLPNAEKADGLVLLVPPAGGEVETPFPQRSFTTVWTFGTRTPGVCGMATSRAAGCPRVVGLLVGES
ncbi:hypothetical protein H1C71_039256, partial [Ictidomys tridecemlineatus]